MSKPFTWIEIRDILLEKLKNSKHILTFGTIGSCNVERDIDLIITKKESSKTADFYKETHELFDYVNEYISKRYGGRLICFSRSEPESLALARYSNKDLAFHFMVYTTYSQIERDWNWSLLKKEGDIKKIVLTHYDCLLGSASDLFSKKIEKQRYFDPILLFLYMYDRINSGYEKNVMLKVMNHYFDFFFRKKLRLKTPIANNEKEIREIFYKLGDTLDNLEKNY